MALSSAGKVDLQKQNYFFLKRIKEMPDINPSNSETTAQCGVNHPLG